MLEIDIVIPVYNKEKFLSELLESLLSKSYLFDKIIVVDDCSTDNSINIIKKYKKDNPEKIIYHVQEFNQGPHYARIKGAQLSNKDFLMFVDADDLINLEGLEIFISSDIKWNDYGIFFGNTHKIYSSVIDPNLLYPYSTFSKKLMRPLDLEKYKPTMSGILIRKDIVSLMKVGNCTWGEDIIFYVKAITVIPFLYKDVTIGIYRIMEGTRGTSGGTFSKRLLFLKSLFLALKFKSVSDIFMYIFLVIRVLSAWLVKKIY